MPAAPLTTLDLPIPKLRSGKVREVFDLGDKLLFVATDRLSAFDVILPDPIPDKGAVLNQISAFWFQRFDFVAQSHDHGNSICLTSCCPFANNWLVVRCWCEKLQPLPVECVVRGYLAGSGWKDYQETGAICGHKLPPGLQQAAQLPEPIFTPATKSESGHDLNIDWAECCRLLGEDDGDESARSEFENLRGRSRLCREPRHHCRRHEIRIRHARRRIAADRRMPHARFVALLAGR